MIELDIPELGVKPRNPDYQALALAFGNPYSKKTGVWTPKLLAWSIIGLGAVERAVALYERVLAVASLCASTDVVMLIC